MREIWMNMVTTTYYSTDDMIDKLHSLKGKTKLKIHKNISKFYDNMKIRMDEDLFSKNAESNCKIHHEVLLLNFSLTKPQVKFMNTNYYDLYYTVIKNRDENKF